MAEQEVEATTPLVSDNILAIRQQALSISGNGWWTLLDELRMTTPASDSAELSELLAGTGYRALARLGRGAMGEVFEVEHELLGRRFAAKLLRADLTREPHFVDRLRVEAQAMARLHHPNIVEVTDFCVARGGRPFLIMERLRGRTLARELAERGPLPVREAAVLARQALAALAAAHALGVVHRDIKPENLFLHEVMGGGRTLKVLDFGLARVLPHAPASAPLPVAIPTATGQFIGTPRFWSPEAIRGERVDHRADLYAMGLVLFNALTGHGPFDHLTIAETLSHTPEPPSRFRSEPSVRALDALVLCSLRKAPEHRFQSADEFSAALAAATPPA